jgi:hypothetical protein
LANEKQSLFSGVLGYSLWKALGGNFPKCIWRRVPYMFKYPFEKREGIYIVQTPKVRKVMLACRFKIPLTPEE